MASDGTSNRSIEIEIDKIKGKIMEKKKKHLKYFSGIFLGFFEFLDKWFNYILANFLDESNT